MLIDIITPTIPQRKEYLDRLKNCISNINLPIDVKFNHIIIESKNTAGANRNIALSQCKGDYIYYIDDDDIPLKNLICNTVLQYMKARVPLIYWDASLYEQPNEADISNIKPDRLKTQWKPGITASTYTTMYNTIGFGKYNYPVGSYIVRSDFKYVKWPESSSFGEDIHYNKALNFEVSKNYDILFYVPDEKVIIIKHAKSTTYGGDINAPKRDMLWHLKEI